MIDGVIKYDFDFRPTGPLEPELYGRIEAVRERLFALGLVGEADGIGYGNVSERLDGGRFVVTGTQTGALAHLGGEHYALVERCDDRNFRIRSSGMVKPSSESLTHGTVYNLSGDIGAVIHVHSAAMWRYMLDNGYRRTEDVPYGSREMIDEVNRIYEGTDPLSHPGFVMAGHEDGVMFFGRDLAGAERALLAVIAAMLRR